MAIATRRIEQSASNIDLPKGRAEVRPTLSHHPVSSRTYFTAGLPNDSTLS